MTSHLKLLTATLAGLICLTTPRTHAQGSPGDEVSFRVLCFEHRDNVTSALAPSVDGSKNEVPLFTSDFSDIIKSKFAGGKAEFFVEESGPDGKVQRKVVAEGKLAKGTRQAFVLIPNAANTTPTYRIVAFEDGEESFPMGSTRLINLAPYPIRLNLAGADTEPVKPGGIGMYPIVKQVDEWNMYTAKVQFGVAEGKWVDVSTQSWKASAGKRDWVICRFDAVTKQPVIRQYQDIPPWRKTALPTGGGAGR